ncbi:baseplate J/gp47 family protein [Desulfuribacillus alkaliarsenatis]|uniref:Uncharacterized protein n=1 Tax=Desulfuribacillus alkaliarsenatis TaxID=766136 RepID=A0A1E5G299_9FIRM|nr:baseplate J/gp47 family protein [Desulfuribacillus alkaliarsenatis]OEF97118.1 hypothetical protein BHF68_05850 [Desulfuribacillus alkaliarsenatis]
MEYPLLDIRDKNLIKEQIRRLASFYVPEWNNSNDETDVGDALADLFATIFSDTIQHHVNLLPLINYVHFLNCIRVGLLPGTSAEGHVTVRLNEGAEQGVYVKRGTKLFVDKGEEIGHVLYETEHDCFAIDNQVTHVFCANGWRNIITNPWHWQQSSTMNVRLFDEYKYKNLQNHAVYFSNQDILNIRQGSTVAIELQHRIRRLQGPDMAANLADKTYFHWMMLTEKGWETIENVSSSGSRILLTINKELPTSTYNDIEGRWLLCQRIPNLEFPEIIVENVRMSAKAEYLQPEIMIYNDLELDNHGLLPFGENFAIYDDFYIGSEEVLTKRGSYVELLFQMAFKRFQPPNIIDEESLNWKLIMREENFQKQKPQDVVIEEVVWEYWNGDGWARLMFDVAAEEIFSLGNEEVQKIKLAFICPEDTAPGYINAHQNYWIRARIRKVRNAYKQNVLYLCPVIEKLQISYQYRAETRAIEHLLVERDLSVTQLSFDDNTEKALFQKQNPANMAAYFCLKNPIQGGPLTIYFSVKEQWEIPKLPLRWEYLADEVGGQQWVELKVSDETKMLSRSGLVTMTGKSNAAKAVCFAQEGYWIRVLCYADTIAANVVKDVPEITGCYLNTIKVSQQETYPTEYFSVEPHQPNKVCELTGDNLIWQSVWVDEHEQLTDSEWNKLIEAGNYLTELERDDTGIIVRRWVQWKPVQDVFLADANDRCYMVDPYHGSVIFGNGANGRIPTSGQGETIRIQYKAGKGEYGNLAEREMTSFSDAVPFVNEAYNAEPIIGGTSKETMELALDRGPSILSSRGAAVTLEDYINIVKQADRNIVRVRCLRHQNAQGRKDLGAITLAILPIFYNKHAMYFNMIKNNVLKALKDVAPSMIVEGDKLHIVETKYLELNLEIKLVIADYNDYQTVLQRVEKRLKDFIEPIHGNYDGKGWKIGEYPNREKLYHIIKQEEKIRRIDSMTITANLVSQSIKQAVNLEDRHLFLLSVPISGEVIIDIEVG